MEANEHAYIVFGKNINGSKHIREQKRTEENIAENKICARDVLHWSKGYLFFFLTVGGRAINRGQEGNCGGLMLDKLFCLCVDIILTTAYTEGMPGEK